MRFCVQYCLDNQRRMEEVEAGSPEEAVVKFRLTRPGHHEGSARRCQVLSVSRAPICNELSW